MEITKDTRVSDILEEYGDIADVMEVFGVKRYDCTVAYANVPVPGAYRGYGAPQALFALEFG